jgi:hypothetical protein
MIFTETFDLIFKIGGFMFMAGAGGYYWGLVSAKDNQNKEAEEE